MLRTSGNWNLKEVVRVHHSTNNGSTNTVILKITSYKEKKKELLGMMWNMNFLVKSHQRGVVSDLGQYKKAINCLIQSYAKGFKHPSVKGKNKLNVSCGSSILFTFDMLGLHYVFEFQHEILYGSMRYHVGVFLNFHSSYYFLCYHSLCVWIYVN